MINFEINSYQKINLYENNEYQKAKKAISAK